MINKAKKITIVGCGYVGMSYAYSLLNQGIGDIIALIDINMKKAQGEAMDLNHGLAFAPKKMKIYAGNYEDFNDTDLIVITAGVPQKENETRLDLLKRNAIVMKEIVAEIKKTTFNGLILVATNPVDILSYIVYKESGIDSKKVIGSGTILDSARLRFEISEKLKIDPRNVHALILGEHGDSEFVCWSNASVSVKPLLDIITEKEISFHDMEQIYEDVKNAAYKIIETKNATYYGVGICLAQITKVLLENQRNYLSVSTLVNGEYEGIEDVYIGVPALLASEGVVDILELNLNRDEAKLLKESAKILKDMLKEIGY